MSGPANLRRADARGRRRLLNVDSYDVELDLTSATDASALSFRSTTTIAFTATAPGSTFVDLAASALHRVTLNGTDLDPGGWSEGAGLNIDVVRGPNTIRIDAEMPFTNAGEGMHRFVDLVDSHTYLYTQFEPASAQRVYACFDQPDLKATFSFTVRIPSGWRATSNGRVHSEEEGPRGTLVRFAPTKRISTYVTAVVAGPYHVTVDHHHGLDLSLWCRQSLAEHLDSAELFSITKAGLDWYQSAFEIPYPFDKHDQCFVPEFLAGGMENAGCVTLHEELIFRGPVTSAELNRRADVILHELAHMWFGDLVTMLWWDDLWLNESFATLVAALCRSQTTGSPEPWVVFANQYKELAYRADQLPSAHPVAADAPDVRTAESNFDAITYTKGASVLRQLVAYVGVDEFFSGVRSYLAHHAFKNTELADLLQALEAASGRELGEWGRLWLETSGLNTLQPDFVVDREQRFTSFDVVQRVDSTIVSNVMRPHRVAIGLYDEVDGRLKRTSRVEVDVTGPRTPVPQLTGARQPSLLLVNDDDLTYCKLRLDPRSLHTLRGGGFLRLDDALTRAICWAAAWDMTRDGELNALDYVDLVIAGAPHETDPGAISSHVENAMVCLDRYADPRSTAPSYDALAGAAHAALHNAPAGSGRQLAWCRAVVVTAHRSQDATFLEALLSGSVVVEGLVIDTELRWSVVQQLCALGRLDGKEIEAELERDPTVGQWHAVTARALRPTPAAKLEAWRLAVQDTSTTNAVQEAAIAGFAHWTQSDLTAPYAAAYFSEVVGAWARRPGVPAHNVARGLFPKQGAAISAKTVTAADRLLSDPSVPSGLRRYLLEGRDEVRRALEVRARQHG